MNRLTNGNNKKRYSNNKRTRPRLVKANVMRARRVSNHNGNSFVPKMTIKKNKAIVILLISLMLIFAMKNNYISAFFTDVKHVMNAFSIEARYTISFNSNTGSGSMENQRISYNVNTPLDSNTFTKSGYAFTGWNTAANGSGTSYSDGEEVNNIGDTTLFAQWEKLNTIKYAVQIYGINQDEDENGNPLGLTFGPATENDYTNKYITHSYEETSSGSNMYYVVRNIHTVAANGVDTVSTAYLYKNGGNTEKVVRSAAEKAKYDVNIHTMTWTEIANTVDKTVFLDCMLCGDTKSVTFTLNDTIASGNTFTQYGDGTGMLLNSIAPYYRMWNPSNSSVQYPERNNAAAIHGSTEGSNAVDAGGYSTSHMRATLIGLNSKTDVGYAGNVNLSESNSLYSCIENELKNVITAKRIKYVTGTDDVNYTINNDIADKIWLFSPREEFGSGSTSGNTGEGIGTEGTGYDKFRNNESKSYIALYDNDSANGRTSYKEDGQRNAWWLRTPSLDYDSHPIIVHKWSHITCSPAFESEECGIAIGFCLQGEYNVTFNANGGTGTMTNQKISNNVPTHLKPNEFTNGEYAFVEWNTAADGSGISFDDEETVTNIGNVTLYAQWKKNVDIKYAVQIYGINQDVDENENPLGLTFGPAFGDNYNNKYVTHRYEETSTGSGVYYVKIVTHTVAANGTETSSEDFLYEEGGNTVKVTRTTEEKNKYDMNLHNMTWEQIANVTDKTKFLDCMLCGDTKSVDLVLNGKIGTGIEYTQYGDGVGGLYKTIEPYYLEWNPSYDSTEYPECNNSAAINGGNAGANAKRAGGYSTSHMRATLIGVNSKTDVTYAGDKNLTADNCLYSCIDSGLRNIITAKKVKYYTEVGDEEDDDNDIVNTDIADKIWNFSSRELYTWGHGLEAVWTGDEGYDKFVNPESRFYISSSPNNDATIKRTNYIEDEIAVNLWCRTPNDYTTFIVDCIQGSGAFNADYAYDYCAIGFGFCLQGEYSVTFNANGGTGTMPNQSVPNNVATNLNSCTFDRDEYNFAGWNTKADGTGTNYAEKEAVANLGNITLFAQWKPVNAKYAVQIYGINQDVDENNNPLGLTFGPATQEDCNNAYITHRYEETSAGSGQYYVKIVKHAVAANGTETTTEDFLYANGGTTTKVTRTEEEKNKYDINMHNMTWEEIAAVQDKTSFLDCMLCGDTKSVKITLNNTIGDGTTFNQYGDGAGMLAFTIRQYYIMWNPAFNNERPERNNSAATNGGSMGSNGKDAGGYSSSHIRATIIGANSKTDVTYAGDVNLTADNCLYSCLPSNLKNVITAKKIKYVTGDQADYVINDDICDKIWLFSKREVYGSGQLSGETAEGLGVNGDGYDKFGNPNSRSYMASYTNEDAEQRLCSCEYGSFDMWWLRSPGLDWDGSACNINSTGYVAGFIPAIDLSLAFGFCIR